MPLRDTTSGDILENMILPALDRHYKGRYRRRHLLPEPGLGGRRHYVDVLVEREDGKQILISLKYQGTAGTVEEKVPYEVIKLISAIRQGAGKYPYAYIILAGTGFSRQLREFYLSGGLAGYILDWELIKIITLDQFLELANRKKL